VDVFLGWIDYGNALDSFQFLLDLLEGGHFVDRLGLLLRFLFLRRALLFAWIWIPIEAPIRISPRALIPPNASSNL
jgi:hypothetical protein